MTQRIRKASNGTREINGLRALAVMMNGHSPIDLQRILLTETETEGNMKRMVWVGIVGLMLAGCSNEAQVASQNLSQAADNFGINRRIVFYNSLYDKYMLEVEGLCSIGSGSSVPREITVTCKVGPTDYKKHFLGLSSSVTFFSEQLEPAKASVYHYKVTFNPATILPSIDVR